MASATREARIIDAVPCPRCKAAIGEYCRNPVPHQAARGPQDRRAQPTRCHTERRTAWQRWINL
jgi:hypothetical protein